MVTINERMKKIIVDVLGVDENEVVPNALLVEDLHADSFNLVELMMAMESEFEIKIKPEEMEMITTVKEAQDYLKQRLD